METIKVGFGGKGFLFRTEKGVFSPNQLDLGSRVLLENAPEAKYVLDLGCGYGAIGIIYANLHPESYVTLIDNDPSAIELAKENAKSNNVTNVKILKADVTYSTLPQEFDLVLSNPPWTKNRSVVPALINFAYQHLKDGGKFCLVINQSFRTEDLLLGTFGNEKQVASRPPYKILQAIKTGDEVNDLLATTKETLARLDFKPDALAGQYFLTDSEIIAKLVAAADLSKKDSVLEIGPGLGAITSKLAAGAGTVTAIEIENKFKPVLHQLPKSVTLIFDDFFKIFRGQQRPFAYNKIVANLPFMAAGAMIKNLSRFPIDRAVLIVPEKLAKNLGAEILFPVPCSFFYPLPDVDAVAIKLTNWPKSTL